MLYDEFKIVSINNEANADGFESVDEFARALQMKAVLQLAQVEHLIIQDPHSLKAAFKAGEAAATMEVAAQLLHHFADVQADAKSDRPMDPMADLDDIINSIRGGTAPERGTK